MFNLYSKKEVYLLYKTSNVLSNPVQYVYNRDASNVESSGKSIDFLLRKQILPWALKVRKESWPII